MTYATSILRTRTRTIGGVFAILTVLCALFVLTAHPAHAQALSVTNMPSATGGALKITPSAVLFTITFTLGSENGDMLVPATALRSINDELDTKFAHYYIEDKSGDIVTDGTTAAILLSSEATLDGSRYRIPEGEKMTFTLLGLFVTEEEDPAFRMRLRTIPFEIDGYIANQQYNRHELEKYRSAPAALNNEG